MYASVVQNSSVWIKAAMKLDNSLQIKKCFDATIL